jgi:hypothetical protein
MMMRAQGYGGFGDEQKRITDRLAGFFDHHRGLSTSQHNQSTHQTRRGEVHPAKESFPERIRRYRSESGRIGVTKSIRIPHRKHIRINLTISACKPKSLTITEWHGVR